MELVIVLAVFTVCMPHIRFYVFFRIHYGSERELEGCKTAHVTSQVSRSCTDRNSWCDSRWKNTHKHCLHCCIHCCYHTRTYKTKFSFTSHDLCEHVWTRNAISVLVFSQHRRFSVSPQTPKTIKLFGRHVSPPRHPSPACDMVSEMYLIGPGPPSISGYPGLLGHTLATLMLQVQDTKYSIKHASIMGCKGLGCNMRKIGDDQIRDRLHAPRPGGPSKEGPVDFCLDALERHCIT